MSKAHLQDVIKDNNALRAKIGELLRESKVQELVIAKQDECIGKNVFKTLELAEENAQLKARLEQYESTPARALKAVMERHDIHLFGGIDSQVVVSKGIAYSETIALGQILSAEDIEQCEEK